jgi:hypothetical protein
LNWFTKLTMAAVTAEATAEEGSEAGAGTARVEGCMHMGSHH